MRKLGLFALLMASTLLHGCGYTSKTVLPNNIESLYVKTVRNEIPIGELVAYQPGLEMDITKAVIRRLQRDGNLKLGTETGSDAILDIVLKRYDLEGVRFSRLETVQEFRVFLVLDMQLIDARTNQVLWREENFSGDDEFFVSTVRTIAREEATAEAIERLAKNVIDRIVEDW